MDSAEQDRWKKAAAEAAVSFVKDGMVVGLGTGSTAGFFIRALAERISLEGIRISGIPTSEQTADLSNKLRIPLTTFSEHIQVDLTVDGADEVERDTLFLIKGHGGALLREKIVAAASKRMIVVADETKVVQRLGVQSSVPVEVVRFGWQTTETRLAGLGAATSMRVGRDGKPFVTDCGNYIIDCNFGAMANPGEIMCRLSQTVGAIDHGLFLGLASLVLVGGRNGVEALAIEAMS